MTPFSFLFPALSRHIRVKRVLYHIYGLNRATEIIWGVRTEQYANERVLLVVAKVEQHVLLSTAPRRNGPFTPFLHGSTCIEAYV